MDYKSSGWTSRTWAGEIPWAMAEMGRLRQIGEDHRHRPPEDRRRHHQIRTKLKDAGLLSGIDFSLFKAQGFYVMNPSAHQCSVSHGLFRYSLMTYR